MKRSISSSDGTHLEFHDDELYQKYISDLESLHAHTYKLIRDKYFTRVAPFMRRLNFSSHEPASATCIKAIRVLRKSGCNYREKLTEYCRNDGVLLSATSTVWNTLVRVHAGGVTLKYKLDRWG
jgi:hypothetical protein